MVEGQAPSEQHWKQGALSIHRPQRGQRMAETKSANIIGGNPQVSILWMFAALSSSRTVMPVGLSRPRPRTMSFQLHPI